MSISRSICCSLTVAAALACRTKRDRDPDVPGTNANGPRVVEAEDPRTHQPIASAPRPSASAPAGASPEESADLVDRDKAPLGLDAGVADAPAPPRDAGR